jgi:hypothetical protein
MVEGVLVLKPKLADNVVINLKLSMAVGPANREENAA